MPHSPEYLSSQFQLPGLSFETGNGGLTKAVINSAAATGEIYLHGAHVTAFAPAGEPQVLWVSRKSNFAADQPIRGGIPICFPWFGPKQGNSSAPGHGLARTKDWEITEAVPSDDGGITVTLQTVIEDYSLTLQVTFGKQLTLRLKVTLATGASGPTTFEEAMHTYFSVGGIQSVSITGLEPSEYIDKVDGAQRKPAAATAIKFDGECDRVYLDTTATCQLTESGISRSIIVGKEASQNTVVWNPWIAKSERMPDFGDEEWTGMVCIETANVGDSSVTLQPGESHTMTAMISTKSS